MVTLLPLPRTRFLHGSNSVTRYACLRYPCKTSHGGIDTDEIRTGVDPLEAIEINPGFGDEGIENDLGPESGDGNGVFGDLGDGGQGNGNGDDTDWSDPTRGRPRNKADSPFVNIIPFAKFQVPPDLYFLAVAYWEAHDLKLAELTAEEQGQRVVDYVKAIALEHFLADQENEEDERQYKPELLFTGALKKIAEREVRAATEQVSEDLRRSLADKIKASGRETFTLDEAVDLVLLGGEALG